MRRTKILATIGPNSESKEILTKMVKSGLNAVRCNFSHGHISEHVSRIQLIREISKDQEIPIGIIVDLQGPKIRVKKFKFGQIYLKKGSNFILEADPIYIEGDETRVGIDYQKLPQDVKSDDILLLDDGKIILKVIKIINTKIYCIVITGGILSNNKGINKKGGGLSAAALTEKDKRDIEDASKLDIDYFAVSFPRDAKDLKYARQLLQKSGSKAGIIAKIERIEAIENINEIIQESDGIMIARGDLAVEIGIENVPSIQKKLIQKARKFDKISIVATQMMESMIHCSTPTRAEVSDVANAVLDGADAVMLSAESATGSYPLETIQIMSRICKSAEENNLFNFISSRNNSNYFNYNNYLTNTDKAIAISTIYLANNIKANAIISLTNTGSKVLLMSRVNTNLLIYAFSINPETLGRMTLYRNIIPIKLNSNRISSIDDMKKKAILKLKSLGFINSDDSIIMSNEKINIHGDSINNSINNSIEVFKIDNI